MSSVVNLALFVGLGLKSYRRIVLAPHYCAQIRANEQKWETETGEKYPNNGQFIFLGFGSLE